MQQLHIHCSVFWAGIAALFFLYTLFLIQRWIITNVFSPLRHIVLIGSTTSKLACNSKDWCSWYEMLFFNIPLCEHSFWCMGVITYDIVLSFPVYLSFNRIHFELFFGFLVLFWRKVHTSKSYVVRLPESITVYPTPHFVFPHFRIRWTNQLSCGAHMHIIARLWGKTSSCEEMLHVQLSFFCSWEIWRENECSHLTVSTTEAFLFSTPSDAQFSNFHSQGCK